jgi:hypothetical protein
MMHSEITSGLYTTLINLSPIAYREMIKKERRKIKKEAFKLSSLLLSIVVWMGYEQLMKGPSMTGILKLGGFGSRRLPSHPSSGRRCTQAPATPT